MDKLRYKYKSCNLLNAYWLNQISKEEEKTIDNRLMKTESINILFSISFVLHTLDDYTTLFYECPVYVELKGLIQR